jgi:hypothetical protein
MSAFTLACPFVNRAGLIPHHYFCLDCCCRGAESRGEAWENAASTEQDDLFYLSITRR